MLILGRLGLLVLVAAAGSASAQQAEPLEIRNLNPLVAIFGLPPWDVPTEGRRLEASFDVANHYRLSLRNGELLVLDGETTRTAVSFGQGFGERWSIGAELPIFHVSGGVLDDLIDGWHSAFRLPDGGRNNRPEGDLLFLMGDEASLFFELAEPQTGLGDVQLSVARSFGSNDAFVLQATVKLPTGDEEMLAGSGSTDSSLTFMRTRALPMRQRAAGYFWGVGVVHAGDPTLIDFDSEEWVYTAILGGTWQAWTRFGLKAQLDYHSPFYNSTLEEIGEAAIQVSFGAWMRRNDRSWLEFGIVEDLEVSTAPDVVLKLAAHWSWE
jgi:hypothetical protein